MTWKMTIKFSPIVTCCLVLTFSACQTNFHFFGPHYPNKLKNVKTQKKNGENSRPVTPEINRNSTSINEVNFYLLDEQIERDSVKKQVDSSQLMQNETNQTTTNASIAQNNDPTVHAEMSNAEITGFHSQIDTTKNEWPTVAADNRKSTNDQEQIKKTHPLIKYFWVFGIVAGVGFILGIFASGGNIEDLAAYVFFAGLAAIILQLLAIRFTLKKPDKYKKQALIVSALSILLALILMLSSFSL